MDTYVVAYIPEEIPVKTTLEISEEDSVKITVKMFVEKSVKNQFCAELLESRCF